MGTHSKLLEEKCIYPKDPQLRPEMPDLWSCAQSCELSVPAEAKLTARDLKNVVGFAVLLLAQDSSWAMLPCTLHGR